MTITRCPVCQEPADGSAACHDRCAAHVRQIAAVLARISPQQRQQALQLVTDGGIVPGGTPGVWHVVSSDGGVVYPAGATFCGCPARVTCYHSAAVIITAAAAATLASATPDEAR
jgi:hypothetical protein